MRSTACFYSLLYSICAISVPAMAQLDSRELATGETVPLVASDFSYEDLIGKRITCEREYYRDCAQSFSRYYDTHNNYVGWTTSISECFEPGSDEHDLYINSGYSTLVYDFTHERIKIRAVTYAGTETPAEMVRYAIEDGVMDYRSNRLNSAHILTRPLINRVSATEFHTYYVGWPGNPPSGPAFERAICTIADEPSIDVDGTCDYSNAITNAGFGWDNANAATCPAEVTPNGDGTFTGVDIESQRFVPLEATTWSAEMLAGNTVTCVFGGTTTEYAFTLNNSMESTRTTSAGGNFTREYDDLVYVDGYIETSGGRAVAIFSYVFGYVEILSDSEFNIFSEDGVVRKAGACVADAPIFADSYNDGDVAPVDGCDYTDAHLYGGWGWNAATSESCAPLSDDDDIVTPVDNGTCDYSNADVNGGWGWDSVNNTSCAPVGDVGPDEDDSSTCDYSNAAVNGGWGWDSVNGASCPPQ